MGRLIELIGDFSADIVDKYCSVRSDGFGGASTGDASV
jgi:hypothetical protein